MPASAMTRLSFTLGAMALMALGAEAQAPSDWKAPRNSFGQPDLQGTWNNGSLTNLERGAQYKDLIVPDAQAEQAAHFADRTRVFPTLFLTPRSKVIETFTRIGPKELLYQYTIEDPVIYSAPWLAEYSFYLSDKPLYEFGCHEGNYSLPNIMKGERVREARAAGRAY